MAQQEIELSTRTRETLDRHHLSPLWEVAEEELAGARDNLEPHVWRWSDVRTAVDGVAEDIPSDVTPRVTVPVNPTYGAALSHTISVGVEVVPPEDVTPAHRHSGHFFRFAVDGDPEMETTVGGEAFPMTDNDLITIPQWEWHGHHNGSDGEAAWLVVDDGPLRIDALNVGNLHEDHEDERQPITRSDGYHRARYGNCRPRGGTVDRPDRFEGSRTPTPPYRFEWSEMSTALDHAEADEPARSRHDGVVVEYANPARGEGPLFPTLGVRTQRLLDGERTATHSHNATEVFHVLEGTGRTVVEGEPLEWGPRDLLVVPTYRDHAHEADDEATLLAVSDRPVLEAINCYHEFEPS